MRIDTSEQPTKPDEKKPKATAQEKIKEPCAPKKSKIRVRNYSSSSASDGDSDVECCGCGHITVKPSINICMHMPADEVFDKN